ncbi:MAG: cbb3-type cytochrome c oxidase subunit I [Myxococcota bacterium]
MAAPTSIQDPRRPEAWVWVYFATVGIVVALMMVFGLVMRLGQAGLIELPLTWFYQLMTMHGVGMVGISGVGGAAILYHFLSQHVELSRKIFIANFVLFLIGAVLLLGPSLLGSYAGAWTFLYPLPQNSGGQWAPSAAAIHLTGLALVGVGFLLFHLDNARAILARYGSLGNALGWPQLFGNSSEEPPPASVVAGTMVLIVNILGLVSGASIIVLSIVGILNPSFEIDALLAKNMIYMFGHVFINATIYMSVTAVYELLPLYTGRPWKVNKVFLAAWNISTIFVVIVYPHHLLMDFAQPTWLHVLGQVISYGSGFPVLVVTAFGALTLIHRSGIRWTAASGFLVLSMFGWSAGVIPAVVDGTIAANQVMHNTQWVPGHFHFYLVLGLVSMFFGFALHYSRGTGDSAADRVALWTYAIAGLGFTCAFLAAGAQSVPRRWAIHLEEWHGIALVGSVFGALVVVATLLLVVRIAVRARSVA